MVSVIDFVFKLKVIAQVTAAVKCIAGQWSVDWWTKADSAVVSAVRNIFVSYPLPSEWMASLLVHDDDEVFCFFNGLSVGGSVVAYRLAVINFRPSYR